MDWGKFLLVGSGGFCGANLRYWLGGWIQSKLGVTFPWQTLIINVSGALLIGLFLEIAIQENWNPGLRLFIAIGVLGGYTTYSTFAYESLNLLNDKLYGWSLFYILGSAVFTVAAAWLGRFFARLILGA